MRPVYSSTCVKHVGLSLLIVLFIFFCHYKSQVFTSFDSRYSIHVAESLIKNGDINLDEYEFSKNTGDYALFQHRGHVYSVYPILPSIIALPVVAILGKINIERKLFLKICEKTTASFMVALTSLILFHMVMLVSGNLKVSFLLLICFAFSTTAWSIASRALWSHGPSMLLVSLILYILLVSEKKNKPDLIPLTGILAGLAYMARPGNAAMGILLSIYVFVKFRQQFWRFISGGICVAIIFVCFNQLFYELVFQPYYTFPIGINRELLSPWLLKVTVPNPDMTEAVWGNLISPNRGLFVFSPVFFFCFFGIYLKIKNKTFQSIDCLLVCLFIFHLLIISKTLKYWWGGYSFGPRYFTDILPIFIYFLIPAVIESWGKYNPVLRNKIYFLVFFLFLSAGIFIHWQGATNEAVWKWNSREEVKDWINGTDDHIDWHPERVWDFHDLQFLRGFQENDTKGSRKN